MSDTQEKVEETGNYRDEKGRLLPGHPGMGGRPKGTSLLAIIKRKLNKTVLIDGEEISLAETIVDNYLKSAIEKNDGPAIRDLMNRIDGEPTKTIITANDEDSEFIKAIKEIKEKLAG